MSKFTTLITCLTMTIFCHSSWAQEIPDEFEVPLQTELSKRGLSQAEAQAELFAKGIDLSKMKQEDIVTQKGNILRVLDDLAAGKQKNSGSDTLIAEVRVDTTKEIKTIIPPKPNQMDIVPIYGHQLFGDGGLPVQAMTDGANAPDSYILGVGDQIRITIFGISQADLLLTINEAGFVAPAGMGQIYLKGLSLRDARKVIRNRFSVAYRFQSDEFAVTLQKARMLNVNIFGEVVKAGSLQLSALNTALNALMGAGGVNEIGSVRHIELMRGDTRKKIDLYAFLNNPSVQFQYDLQHNDILYVPVAQKVVNLEGAVKRPMRYELAGKEGLKELIAFAGGVLYNANIDLIQVERQTGATPILTEYRLNEVLEGKVVVELLDGDIIRLRPSAVPLEQITSVEGAVYYPGNFAWKEGQKLTDVLAKAQLKPQTSTELYFVERTLTDGTKKLYKVAGKDAAVFAMAAKDRVLVYDQSTYANQLPLEVSGAVRAPFKQVLAYSDQILLSEALALAKGTLPTTADWAYVRRPNLFEPNLYSYVRINLRDSLNFALGAGDVLMVYDKEIYSQAANVSINGAVREALNIPFSPQLTIQGLIEMAGRPTQEANLNRVDVFRLYYNEKRGSGYELIQLSIDSNFNVMGYPSGFAILPFDQVVVREKALYALDKHVSVKGAVKFPGHYALPASPYRLSDLIADAGGLNVLASKDKAIIIRSANELGPIGVNLKKAMNRKYSKKFNPILLADDVLEVFNEQNTFSIRILGTNYPTLDSAQNQASFIYSGKHSARWYLREYAGGLQMDADKRSVSVAYPNGQVDGTKRVLFVFNDMPTVKSGGQIVVNMKAPEENQEKKDIDYDAIFTRSFQAISSMLTISLLIKQL